MRNVNYLFFYKKNVLERILLSCFLFFSLHAQTAKSFVSKSVLDYANYFERNKSNLDPIEGIWKEYAVGTLYEDTKVLSRLEERKRATWIVIKKYKRNLLPNKNMINSNDSFYIKLKKRVLNIAYRKYSYEEYFKVLNSNGSTIGFNAYFVKKKNGLYDFYCKIEELDDQLTTQALMSNQNNLSMQYNAPINFISFFNEEMNYDDNLINKELFWQIEWKKSFK